MSPRRNSTPTPDHRSLQRRRTACLFTLLGAVAACFSILGGCRRHSGPSSRPVATTQPALRSQFDGKRLVEALVNRNAAPEIDGEYPNAGEPLFKKDYDWSEYYRVNGAIDSLGQNALAVWPQLLQHLDDERYCTTRHDEYGHNYSVDGLCDLIVRGCLTAGYARHLHLLYQASHDPEFVGAKFYCPDIVATAADLKSWCEKRVREPLYEQQVEMCEWAIANAIARKRLFDKGQPEPFIRAVQAQIKELRESRQAVPFPGFGMDDFRRYGPDSIKIPKTR
jgi:hypothetical protein